MQNYKLLIKLALLIMLFANLVKADIPGGKISGTVKTSDGKPAPYVTVMIKELSRATSTKDDGTYFFGNVKPGSYTLQISFIGTQTIEKPVSVASSKTMAVDFILNETSSQLNEVNVRANVLKRPAAIGKADISPLDLPQSSGVVTHKVIQDQQVNRLGDAVKNVSGVSLTQTRGGVSETFSARGYSVGIGGGAGSIFKNGVLVNTAGFPEASTLESIEILKGSSALLYGNVSGGLVINLLTKKPLFESGGEVSMRYGSNNLYKPSLDLYGPISKNVAYRLVGTYENAGSYRNHVFNKHTYVNPSLLFKLSDKTTLLVEGDYLNLNLTPDWGVGSLNNGQAIPATPRSQFINTSWAFSHMKQTSAAATLNHQFNYNWHLNAIVSTQGTKIDSYGSSLPNTVNAAGDWNRGLQKANTFEGDYTGQINLNGKFNTGAIKHQLLLGTDVAKILTRTDVFTINGADIKNYAYDKINIIDLNKYTPRTDIPDAPTVTRTTAPVYRFGAYAQDLITLTEQFKVLAGVRWSYQQNTATSVDSVQKAKTVTGAPVKIDKAFSPKVALIYQPAATSSIYVSYSNFFQVNTGTDINNAALKPSIVNQYEAGVKNEFLDGKLSANLSVYRIINSNLSVTSPVDAAHKQLNGQTTSDGIDVDVNGTISKNFYFIAGYSYNFMRYTKTTGLKGSPIEGEQIVVNPRNTANASLFYTFDSAALRGFKVGASAFYTGSRLGGYNNTIGQSQAYSRLLPVGGFTTVDLTTGYTYKKLSLLLAVTNITNTFNYLIHDNYSVTPIAPRQLLTTLAYKF